MPWKRVGMGTVWTMGGELHNYRVWPFVYTTVKLREWRMVITNHYIFSPDCHIMSHDALIDVL